MDNPTLRSFHLKIKNSVLTNGATSPLGDSYDNALAETINGLYKAELIHRRTPWKSREAVELATLEWVSWFNHHRPLEPLGYIPPAKAEANYYRQLSEQAMSPDSHQPAS